MFFSEKSINFRILNPSNDEIRWTYPTVGMRRPLSHGIPLDRPAVALREPVHRADRALPAGEASCIDGQGFVHRGRYDLASRSLRGRSDAPSRGREPLRLRGASRRPRVAGAAHQAPVARQRVQRLPSHAVTGTLRGLLAYGLHALHAQSRGPTTSSRSRSRSGPIRRAAGRSATPRCAKSRTSTSRSSPKGAT